MALGGLDGSRPGVWSVGHQGSGVVARPCRLGAPVLLRGAGVPRRIGAPSGGVRGVRAQRVPGPPARLLPRRDIGVSAVLLPGGHRPQGRPRRPARRRSKPTDGCVAPRGGSEERGAPRPRTPGGLEGDLRGDPGGVRGGGDRGLYQLDHVPHKGTRGGGRGDGRQSPPPKVVRVDRPGLLDDLPVRDHRRPAERLVDPPVGRRLARVQHGVRPRVPGRRQALGGHVVLLDGPQLPHLVPHLPSVCRQAFGAPQGRGACSGDVGPSRGVGRRQGLPRDPECRRPRELGAPQGLSLAERNLLRGLDLLRPQLLRRRLRLPQPDGGS
mmetsp:Transcript_55911/g.127063  ORF Transcript_55911/g.127063 Transcript_55911/m.127063 type:complete len:325 (+) Transcript_55911:237-1211(+)